MPLSSPTLTTVPDLSDISEGGHLNLICAVNGSPPVTFKWFREGDLQPLSTNTSTNPFKDYEIPVVSNQHSGSYYCEAYNQADNKVESKSIYINGETAFSFSLLTFTFLAETVLMYKGKYPKV